MPFTTAGSRSIWTATAQRHGSAATQGGPNKGIEDSNAGIIKMALVQLQTALQNKKPRVQLLPLVHDELVVEWRPIPWRPPKIWWLRLLKMIWNSINLRKQMQKQMRTWREKITIFFEHKFHRSFLLGVFKLALKTLQENIEHAYFLTQPRPTRKRLPANPHQPYMA